MSSVSGTWVQASAISTRLPGLSESIARAPCTKVRTSPLAAASSTEKEVRGHSFGRARSTRPKTCESVMTRSGRPARLARAAGSESGVQQCGTQPRSSSSRSTCTCGRMRRPFGASESCGITSRTLLPACTRLPVRYFCSSRGAAATRRSSRDATLSPRAYRITGIPASVANVPKSGTLTAFSPGFCCQCPSFGDIDDSSGASRTTAMSVSSRIARVMRSRSAPSALPSPRPAVSISTQGPRPGSSMGFRTGSVVVPGIGLTRDTCCPARALTSVDLPLLVGPKKAICNRSIDFSTGSK